MLVHKWFLHRHPIYALLSIVLFLFFVVNLLFVYFSYSNSSKLTSLKSLAINGDNFTLSVSEATIKTKSTAPYNFYECLPYASAAHANHLTLSDKIVKPEACLSDVSIVLLIKSSIFRNTLRNTLRNTWAKEINASHNLKFSVRRFFLIGSPSTDSYRLPLIELESSVHGDLLQGTFEDTYKSVASKVLLGMKFVEQFCPRAKFVVVVDDDSILFPWNLFNALNAKPQTYDQHFYAGFFFGGKTIRDETSRWRLSKEEYLCEWLPPYAGGSMYILSVKSMATLYRLANIFQPIHLEDVYFGVLAQIAGISITPVPYDYINALCPTLLSPHGLSANNNLNLFVCHEADLSKDQEDVWKEYCFRPVSDISKTNIINVYCQN